MSVYRINEKSVKVCVCVCGSGCELCKNRQFLQFSPNVEEIIFSSIWHVIDFGSGMFLWVMFISMFIFFNLILVAPNKSIPHIRHFDIIIWERTVKREKELAANRWGKRQNPRKQMREKRKKESFAPLYDLFPPLLKRSCFICQTCHIGHQEYKCSTTLLHWCCIWIRLTQKMW